MTLQTGKKAPAFTVKIDSNNKVSLSDYKGKWVVLYFYPKDDTPGCTAEACSFRDNMDLIIRTGAVVIGVSPDGISSHDKFKTKYKLNYQLIPDTDKKICEKYGVMGEKTMFGKKVFGVVRTTFIINPDGIISHIFSKVKVDGHVEEVIGIFKKLKN